MQLVNQVIKFVKIRIKDEDSEDRAQWIKYVNMKLHIRIKQL